MRIRRNIIAPLVLAIGAVGAMAVPVVTAMTAAAPASVSVAASPDAIYYFG